MASPSSVYLVSGVRCTCADQAPCEMCEHMLRRLREKAAARTPCQHESEADSNVCNVCRPVERNWEAIRRRAAEGRISEYRAARDDVLDHLRGLLAATASPSLLQWEELVRWIREYADGVPELCDLPNWRAWATPEFAERYRPALRAHASGCHERVTRWNARGRADALYAWEKRHFVADVELLELAIRNEDEAYVLAAHDACLGARWPQAERLLWLAAAHIKSVKVLDVLLQHVDDVSRMIRDATPGRMAFWEGMSRFPNTDVQQHDPDLFVWLARRRAYSVITWLVSHYLHGALDIQSAKKLARRVQAPAADFYPADDEWSRACADNAPAFVNGVLYHPLGSKWSAWGDAKRKVRKPWEDEFVEECGLGASAPTAATEPAGPREPAKQGEPAAAVTVADAPHGHHHDDTAGQRQGEPGSLRDLHDFIQTLLAMRRSTESGLKSLQGAYAMRCEAWQDVGLPTCLGPDSTTHLLPLYWPRGVLWSFAAEALPRMLLAESRGKLQGEDLVRVAQTHLVWHARPEYKSFWPPPPVPRERDFVLPRTGERPDAAAMFETGSVFAAPHALEKPLSMEEQFLKHMLQQFLKLSADPEVAKIGQDFFAGWTHEDLYRALEGQMYDVIGVVSLLHRLGRLSTLLRIIERRQTLSPDAWLYIAEHLPEQFFDNAMLRRLLFVNEQGVVAHRALAALHAKDRCRPWPKANLAQAARAALDGRTHRVDHESVKVLLDIMHTAMPAEYCQCATAILREFVAHGDANVLDMLPAADAQGRKRALELRAQVSGRAVEQRMLVAPLCRAPTFADDDVHEDVGPVQRPVPDAMQASSLSADLYDWVL